MTAERERDELKERLRIHSEKYNAKDRGAKDFNSKQRAKILERKATMANAEKEMWAILRSLTANQSVPTAQSTTDNGKIFLSEAKS